MTACGQAVCATLSYISLFSLLYRVRPAAPVVCVKNGHLLPYSLEATVAFVCLFGYLRSSFIYKTMSQVPQEARGMRSRDLDLSVKMTQSCSEIWCHDFWFRSYPRPNNGKPELPSCHLILSSSRFMRHFCVINVSWSPKFLRHILYMARVSNDFMIPMQECSFSL